jgi:hypothetical protein
MKMTGPGKIGVNSAATKLRWPNMQMYPTMNMFVFNGCLATIIIVHHIYATH